MSALHECPVPSESRFQYLRGCGNAETLEDDFTVLEVVFWPAPPGFRTPVQV